MQNVHDFYRYNFVDKPYQQSINNQIRKSENQFSIPDVSNLYHYDFNKNLDYIIPYKTYVITWRRTKYHNQRRDLNHNTPVPKGGTSHHANNVITTTHAKVLYDDDLIVTQ